MCLTGILSGLKLPETGIDLSKHRHLGKARLHEWMTQPTPEYSSHAREMNSEMLF